MASANSVPVALSAPASSEAIAKRSVELYTDGACLGNPGPGGYGVVLLYGPHRRELSRGFRWTTNNRMELLAAIVGLEALNQRCSVTLHSDSQYLVKAMSLGWARRWEQRGWLLADRQPTLNVDLWKRLLALCQEHDVEFDWVRGHNGNKENERADQLAVEAAHGADLADDEVYERHHARSYRAKGGARRSGH